MRAVTSNDGGSHDAPATSSPAAGAAALDRTLELKAQLATMHIKEPRDGRDGRWLLLGIVLMVAGSATAIVGYVLSHGTTNPLEQADALIVALIGVTISIAGGAVFLCYSLTHFLRFWLARMIYEQSRTSRD
jgi:hypothetical protein